MSLKRAEATLRRWARQLGVKLHPGAPLVVSLSRDDVRRLFEKELGDVPPYKEEGPRC